MASTIWSSTRPADEAQPALALPQPAGPRADVALDPAVGSACQCAVGTVYGSARLSVSAVIASRSHRPRYARAPTGVFLIAPNVRFRWRPLHVVSDRRYPGVAVDTAEKTRALSEQLAVNPLDPKDLVKTFGLIGVWAILFAETGLLVGFFFPGDSLLFLAGVAASPVAERDRRAPGVSLAGLLIGAPICAIVGAQLGHYLGARYGRRMFDRPDSRLFKREYVDKAEYYFNKYGPAKAVVLARFIPIVRTFLNPVAGMLGMPAKTFFLWNVVGAILWTDGIILAGYLLAEQIIKVIDPADIDHYILPVVALIILISVLPIVIEILRDRRHRRAAAEALETAADTLEAAASDATASLPRCDQRRPGRHARPVAALNQAPTGRATSDGDLSDRPTDPGRPGTRPGTRAASAARRRPAPGRSAWPPRPDCGRACAPTRRCRRAPSSRGG